MIPFDKLEINELIDLLSKYSLKYSELKKEMASDRQVKKYKSLVQSLMDAIEKRKRATIGPYNDISEIRIDDRSKTA